MTKKTIKLYLLYLILLFIPGFFSILFISSTIKKEQQIQANANILETTDYIGSLIEKKKELLQELSVQIQEKISLDQDFVYNLLVLKETNSSSIIDFASETAINFNLDLLEIANESGSLISSAQWKANFGNNISKKIAVISKIEKNTFYLEDIKEDSVLTIQVVSSFKVGTAKLNLICGYIIDKEFLKDISILNQLLLVLIYNKEVIQTDSAKNIYTGELFNNNNDLALSTIDIDNKEYNAGLLNLNVMSNSTVNNAKLIVAVLNKFKDLRNSNLFFRAILISLFLSILLSSILIFLNKKSPSLKD